MRRIILFFLISVFTIQLSSGQAKQPSLGILKLDAPELENHKAIKINKYIESAFYKSRRFKIVSRQLNESIQKEREQQKENIDNMVIQQGRAVGADYIVKGFAKLSKKQIYKSSPKSRAPVQQRSRYNNSTTRTSPRTSTSRTQNKEKAKTSTNIKSTTKTSPKTSPRTSTSRNQTSSTPSKTKPSTTSSINRPRSNSSKKPTTKTSPITKEIKPKKETQAAPLSSEIDQVYTSTYISFTIKIIDVKTGVIATEETYKGSINGVTDFVNKIARKTFPYEFKIIEVMQLKGDKKAKHILLDGGTKHGLAKGRYLKAFEVTEENVDGKVLRREIEVGQIYVKRVDTGGNFSMCSILKGKKEILKKTKEGITLYCK